jgi:hypothetical protein
VADHSILLVPPEGLPRAPSLELAVLPISGGLTLRLQTISGTNRHTFYQYTVREHGVPLMELRGLEPLTSAMRMQRSPS